MEFHQVLLNLLSGEDAVRRPAEQRIVDGRRTNPTELLAALTQALATAESSACRQQAGVLMCQMVTLNKNSECDWSEVAEEQQRQTKATLLQRVEAEEVALVLQSVVHAVAKIAELSVEDKVSPGKGGEICIAEWPEVLPALCRWLEAPGQCPRVSPRNASWRILKELAPTIGDALVQSSQLESAISMGFKDESPEVQVSCVFLVLALIEEVHKPGANGILANCVRPMVEILLAMIPRSPTGAKGILEAMVHAIDEQPRFFKPHAQHVLLPALVGQIASNPEASQDIRELSIEVMMTFVERKVRFCASPAGSIIVEQLAAVNVTWLIVNEAECPTEEWCAREDTNFEEQRDDNTLSDFAEENIDRLAKAIPSNVILPIMGKFARGFMQAPTTWHRDHAAMTTMCIMAEHLTEMDTVDEMAVCALERTRHPHPRVRHVALKCIFELAQEHEPRLQEEMPEKILEALIGAVDDEQPRVSTMAMSTFQVFAEGVEPSYIEGIAKPLLEKFWTKLEKGTRRSMREEALTGIAVVAEVVETSFKPYYHTLMPLLKRIIAQCSTNKEWTLLGKAFECLSMLGHAVGKEEFMGDANEAMEGIVQVIRHVESDSPLKEYIHRAVERICQVLQGDFVQYLPHLLEPMLEALNVVPEEVDPAHFDEYDDMTMALLGERVVGLKTSVLEEIMEVLKLVHVFVAETKGAFVRFLEPTCRALLPLLDNPVTAEEDLRNKAFELWGALVQCAKDAQNEKVLNELTRSFVDAVLPSFEGSAPVAYDMANENQFSLLQSQAKGLANTIRAAGKLDSDSVQRITQGVQKAFHMTEEVKMECSTSPSSPNSDDSDTDEDVLSDQEKMLMNLETLRMCLADVFGAVMETNPEEFKRHFLTSFLEFPRKLMESPSQEDRVLSMHVGNDMLEYLGDYIRELGDDYWSSVIDSICDKEAAFRMASCSLIVQGAQRESFRSIALLVVERLERALREAAIAAAKDKTRWGRNGHRSAEALVERQACENVVAALGWVLEHHAGALSAEHAAKLWVLWMSHMPILDDKEEAVRSHAQLLRLAHKEADFVVPAVRILCEVCKTDCTDAVTTEGFVELVRSLGSGRLEAITGGWTHKETAKLRQLLKEHGNMRVAPCPTASGS